MNINVVNAAGVVILPKVFVLDDGGETDLDLGNYERFMGVNLRNESNLTTGYVDNDTRAFHTSRELDRYSGARVNNAHRCITKYDMLSHIRVSRAILCDLTDRKTLSLTV